MCTNCNKKSSKYTKPAAAVKMAAPAKTTPIPQVSKVSNDIAYAGRSQDPTKRVCLIYNGGGSKLNTTGGCRSCHGSSQRYSTVTNETIMFVSEDEHNQIFKRTFSIGHDYWVTEAQAEYLLSLTYINRTGQTVHKFTKKEE